MYKNALLLGVIFGIIMAVSMITINLIEADHINLKIIVSGIIGSSVG